MNISKVAVGYNKGWKDGINIGRKNNRTFCSIPYYRFISMLEYKLNQYGIELKQKSEAYTSKCSFLDGEKVCKHTKYLGRRKHRGLFVSATGKQINADVNGSYNIMRTTFGDASIRLPVNKGYGNPISVKLRC